MLICEMAATWPFLEIAITSGQVPSLFIGLACYLLK